MYYIFTMELSDKRKKVMILNINIKDQKLYNINDLQ